MSKARLPFFLDLELRHKNYWYMPAANLTTNIYLLYLLLFTGHECV